MICLSSAAVVTMARAKALMDKAYQEYLDAGEKASMVDFLKTRRAFIAAAKAVADEAIAERHHEREGD